MPSITLTCTTATSTISLASPLINSDTLTRSTPPTPSLTPKCSSKEHLNQLQNALEDMRNKCNSALTAEMAIHNGADDDEMDEVDQDSMSES